MHLESREGHGGLHRSDQSGRMVECLWSSAGHLACISGQTTTGKRLQYMHTFMRGCKCTQHRFLFLFFFFLRGEHLNEAALTCQQGDLSAEYASTGSSPGEHDCCTKKGLLLLISRLPNLDVNTFYSCSPKGRVLFVCA